MMTALLVGTIYITKITLIPIESVQQEGRRGQIVNHVLQS